MADYSAIPQAQGCQEPVFSPDAPWLAPLAGYSDLPFRLLCREYGASVCETEMISAKGLLYGNSATYRLLASLPADQPLVIQLFGGEPKAMASAVLELRRKGYRVFDCNMGCPVRKVMRQKAGAALMADAALGLAVAKAMLAAALAEPDLPPARVGFKLRLPPSSPAMPGITDFGMMLEDAGAAWLCLHPRTAAQGYGGHADWEAISRLADAVSVPVIASGDLFEAAAGAACLAETGAAAVMYARGALSNPRIFSQHKALLAGFAPPVVDHAAALALIRRHIALAKAVDDNGRAFRKTRSIIPRYARSLAGVKLLRQSLAACADWDALDRALTTFWNTKELCL